MMRFYTRQHSFYCGVDLHARSMYLCILDAEGKTVLHQNYPASPEAILSAIAPFREGLLVGCECMFAWYWLADLCAAEKISFVLGHALYMKAIHGGKSKNDKLDAAATDASTPLPLDGPPRRCLGNLDPQSPTRVQMK